ncbi:hypothetical protein SDC9_143121 [bioreactor metagenome]|uniref:Uncharacterized protein n=1 Tax=bioreactor metagenome TaxID=1076179 RepID=A0A645E355_9ZZZZ
MFIGVVVAFYFQVIAVKGSDRLPLFAITERIDCLHRQHIVVGWQLKREDCSTWCIHHHYIAYRSRFSFRYVYRFQLLFFARIK